MNQPTSMTRFIGTPRIAVVLYVGAGLVVFGCMRGALPWWLAIIALSSAGTVRKAVQDVRRYNHWWASWQTMGGPGTAPPRAARPSFRMRHKNTPPWICVTIAALLLVLMPVCISAPGADEGLRDIFTLLWLGAALYLAWKLVVKLRRSIVRPAGAARAGQKKDNSADVVEWLLPRASSSPSRADAVRRLPAYSARLLTGGGNSV